MNLDHVDKALDVLEKLGVLTRPITALEKPRETTLQSIEYWSKLAIVRTNRFAEVEAMRKQLPRANVSINKPPEYTLETQCKAEADSHGFWYWQIRKTSTGEVVESGKEGYTTEEECCDQAAPFFGDWFAGYMGG